MIWLKKVRNDRLYDGKLNVAVFLQQMMEPFEDYMKSIKEKELTLEILRDAQFHLYQLMEIYVDCKICSIWVTLDEKQSSSTVLQKIKNFPRISILDSTIFPKLNIAKILQMHFLYA